MYTPDTEQTISPAHYMVKVRFTEAHANARCKQVVKELNGGYVGKPNGEASFTFNSDKRVSRTELSNKLGPGIEIVSLKVMK